MNAFDINIINMCVYYTDIYVCHKTLCKVTITSNKDNKYAAKNWKKKLRYLHTHWNGILNKNKNKEIIIIFSTHSKYHCVVYGVLLCVQSWTKSKYNFRKLPRFPKHSKEINPILFLQQICFYFPTHFFLPVPLVFILFLFC